MLVAVDLVAAMADVASSSRPRDPLAFLDGYPMLRRQDRMHPLPGVGSRGEVTITYSIDPVRAGEMRRRLASDAARAGLSSFGKVLYSSADGRRQIEIAAMDDGSEVLAVRRPETWWDRFAEWRYRHRLP